MENAETILVIFLSTFLAIFLLLAIITTVKVLQMIRRLNRIVDTAESLADKAEHAAALIRNAAVPAMIRKLLSSLADAVSTKKARKKR